MATPYELEIFAKQAASDFLAQGKSLTQSIVKLAEDNGLNSPQIARVVEAANTDVYCHLFNKTNDKYVQFETADPAKVEELLGTEKTSEFIDNTLDFNEPPVLDIPAGIAIFEKTAEEKPHDKSPDELLRDYYQFQAAEARLNDLLYEDQYEFSKQANVLSSMIKQAILGGTPYSEIHAALSTNLNPIFTQTLSEIEKDLMGNLPIGSLNKTGELKLGAVNAKHPMVVQSQLLTKIAQNFQLTQTKIAELHDSWELYKQGEVSVLKGVGELIKHPEVAVASAGIGIGATALALPVIAKQRVMQEHSVFNNIPKGYRA